MQQMKAGKIQNKQPIYKHSAETGMANNELEAFCESVKQNIECGKAIDKAVGDSNYELYRYDMKTAVKTVIGEYGIERMAWVLAANINYHGSDGRLSKANKEWAKEYDTSEPDFYLKTHLAVLDGFTDRFREAERESHEPNTSSPPVSVNEKNFNTILEFAFRTGDASCEFWQEWVIAQSKESVDYAALQQLIDSHMNSDRGIRSEYGDIVADIMNKSGLSWEFVGDTFPASRTIHTFWI